MTSPWAMVVRACMAFDHWVRGPVDPRPLAWFRSWLGLLSLVNLWLLWPDMNMWLGNDGVLPPAVHSEEIAGARISVFMITGYSDAAIIIIRGLALAGGLGLWLGICPRSAAFCAWLAAVSYSWRNMHILHSGDNLIRIGTFFLIFARTEGVLSLPLAMRRRFSPPTGPGDAACPGLVPAWPQRILQIQLCILYLAAGIWKALGPTWRNGTAVGLVLQLGEFQRFPIPDFFMTPGMSRVMTYGTLAFELAFPLLVWIPRLRLPVLMAGLAFHAGLDWAMNVQLFQWLITAYYLLWLQPLSPSPPASSAPRSAPVCSDRPARPTPRSSSSPAPSRAPS
jgi:hypothetical protein